jgi:hypothetical protein
MAPAAAAAIMRLPASSMFTAAPAALLSPVPAAVPMQATSMVLLRFLLAIANELAMFAVMLWNRLLACASAEIRCTCRIAEGLKGKVREHKHTCHCHHLKQSLGNADRLKQRINKVT